MNHQYYILYAIFGDNPLIFGGSLTKTKDVFGTHVILSHTPNQIIRNRIGVYAQRITKMNGLGFRVNVFYFVSWMSPSFFYVTGGCPKGNAISRFKTCHRTCLNTMIGFDALHLSS